jgi:phage/plasmid-like protein (TIGR03299 family)
MAHELTETNGTIEMAYVGEKPWHGLGQELTEGATIEQWKAAAGMEWQIGRSRVRYGKGDRIFDDAHVLFRNDTGDALSVVSPKYKIVQPGEVLEFFRDIAGVAGARLETAGTLFGGKKFWALAKIGESEAILGRDIVAQYLLLASSCDGSSATEARETVIRVVCNNTISCALAGKAKHSIKVTHRSVFDPADVKADLEATEGNFAAFVKAARALTRVSVDNAKAEAFIAALLAKATTRDDVTATPAYQAILGLFNGGAIGHDLAGAAGTAWGLVNAVTQYVDHSARAKSTEHRIASAWFGRGDDLKTQAMEAALALA